MRKLIFILCMMFAFNVMAQEEYVKPTKSFKKYTKEEKAEYAKHFKITMMKKEIKKHEEAIAILLSNIKLINSK